MEKTKQVKEERKGEKKGKKQLIKSGIGNTRTHIFWQMKEEKKPRKKLGKPTSDEGKKREKKEKNKPDFQQLSQESVIHEHISFENLKN